MATKQLSVVTSTVETLGEAGDLTAAPGSREWAIAVRLELQSGIRDTKSDAASVLGWQRLFQQHAGYRSLPDEYGQPFQSYRAFCEACPPWGLGYDPDMLTAVLNERKSAQAVASKTVGKTYLDVGPPTVEEKSNVDIVNIRETGGGNATDYLTARIARDHPAILARMKAGEYPSVRAAAIDAGIVKVPSSLSKLQRAWRTAAADERAAFLAWIEEAL